MSIYYVIADVTDSVYGLFLVAAVMLLCIVSDVMLLTNCFFVRSPYIRKFKSFMYTVTHSGERNKNEKETTRAKDNFHWQNDN